jgi:hypothetical protein
VFGSIDGSFEMGADAAATVALRCTGFAGAIAGDASPSLFATSAGLRRRGGFGRSISSILEV